MKVYLVLERYYCDTQVCYVFSDPFAAGMQAQWMNDMNEMLGDSGYYYIKEMEVL